MLTPAGGVSAPGQPHCKPSLCPGGGFPVWSMAALPSPSPSPPPAHLTGSLHTDFQHQLPMSPPSGQRSAGAQPSRGWRCSSCSVPHLLSSAALMTPTTFSRAASVPKLLPLQSILILSAINFKIIVILFIKTPAMSLLSFETFSLESIYCCLWVLMVFSASNFGQLSH